MQPCAAIYSPEPSTSFFASLKPYSPVYFEFKQFKVYHDRSAMKVGTDGCLVGAWSPLPKSGRLLDIGTGCGLIALMAAQREPALEVTGIDIHEGSVLQARENAKNSPFSQRVNIIQADIRTFDAEPFDAIVCNPPFFEEELLPPDAARCAARHTSGLPFADLIRHAARLLLHGGLFSVIIPTSAFDTFHSLCLDNGLTPYARLDVQTTPKKAPKRILLSYQKSIMVQEVVLPHTGGVREGLLPSVREGFLTLQNGPYRTEAYAELMRDFYL